MISRKTALKEAGRFAAALDGPLGRRPMQRVVAQFLFLFRDLRAGGASWAQITALLHSAGVRSGTGEPVAEGALRAMVSRAKRSTRERRSYPPDKTVDPTVPSQRAGLIYRVTEQRGPTQEAGANVLLRNPPDLSLHLDACRSDVAERIRRAARLRR